VGERQGSVGNGRDCSDVDEDAERVGDGGEEVSGDDEEKGATSESKLKGGWTC